MSEFTLALGMVAPYYNLLLVGIVLYLFMKLFKTDGHQKRLVPWKVLFAALLIFVLEEVLTILRSNSVINIPVHINGFFELVIIVLFIYALLKQKEIARV